MRRKDVQSGQVQDSPDNMQAMQNYAAVTAKRLRSGPLGNQAHGAKVFKRTY
jgi:hypothetical protein